MKKIKKTSVKDLVLFLLGMLTYFILSTIIAIIRS